VPGPERVVEKIVIQKEIQFKDRDVERIVEVERYFFQETTILILSTHTSILKRAPYSKTAAYSRDHHTYPRRHTSILTRAPYSREHHTHPFNTPP